MWKELLTDVVGVVCLALGAWGFLVIGYGVS